MKRGALALVLAILLLGAAMHFKGWLIALSPVPDVAVPAGQFDARRAMGRLYNILGDQRPHPVDSQANDAVRERLVAELRAIGLQPRVTDDLVCGGDADARTISCARIRNVVATIGPAAGKHLLLVSHYDSTPVGPGASDDGIGVAVMLETAALLRERPLARPVTFLFDEGEEAGLLGAHAFLRRDPLAPQVDALINLESRGVNGPAVMFETNRPNGAAVSAYARSVERPVANSLTTDFYGLIPNSTDVAVFEERDWTILNFAVIGNETRYHSPGDRLDALDPASVRHMGRQVLSVAGELAASPQAPGAAGERLYADLLGMSLVDIPLALGLALLSALLIAAIWLGFRRRGGLGRAAATLIAALLGSGAIAFLGQSVIGMIRPGDFWRAHPEVIALASYLTAIAIPLFAIVAFARPLALDRLRIAFWLVFLTIGAAASIVAPGAAIFFLLPPLVALAGMVAEERLEGAGYWAGLTAWALLFLTWAPLLHLLEILLDFDAAWIFAPLAVLILLPVLIELKPLTARVPRKGLVAALALLVVAGWAATLAPPAYSEDRKQKFGIEYVWDEKDRRAQWMVVHDGAAFPARFKALGQFEKKDEVPWSTQQRWAVAADGPAVAPILERLGERRTPQGRLVSLRVRANGADVVRFRAPPEADWRAVRVGESVRRFGKEESEDFLLRCHGRSCEGLRVDILVGAPRPVETTIIGTRFALPDEASALTAARPPHSAPQYSPDSTIALARIAL